MKILFLDHYYDAFLDSFHNQFKIDDLSYEAHRSLLLRQRYATSDSYSHHAVQCGEEAEEIIANDDCLQIKWAREHGLRVTPWPRKFTKAANRLLRLDWRFRIVREQIKHLKPDVLFVQERNILNDQFLASVKPYVKLTVSQIASPLPSWRSFRSVDLMLSSFPHFVKHFQSLGIHAEYVPLCVDERFLDMQSDAAARKYQISFVGTVSRMHSNRLRMLERVQKEFDLAWFGRRDKSIHVLRQCYRGELWGVELYKALGESQITLNHHVDAAESYANNMRLFEATGMGACLATDWKENLSDFFEDGKEIVSYRSDGELIEKLKYLRDHPEECRRIGMAGRSRTLREHTYEKRIPSLLKMIRNHMK